MRTKTISVVLPYLLIFLVVFTTASSAFGVGQRATITELTATTSESHLILFCTLENSFTSEMLESLHSGLPLKFSFFVELFKTAEGWPNEQITAMNFQHTMTFDTLKENYRVTIEEENNKIATFNSLFDAQKVINEVNGAKIVDLAQLIPDNHYLLKIRAELYQKTLPMSLHNVLPFFSWWDNKTDWYSIELKY